jgi:chromosome segregation ATPase
MANVQTAMKLAQEDHQQILTLRRDIEAQQKQVEQSLQKEKSNKDTIAELKDDISELTDKIEQGANMTEEQQALLSQLAAQKEQLEKDRDLLKQNTEMLQNITAEQLEKLHVADSSVAAAEENILNIKQRLADKRNEVEKEKL